MSPTLLLLSGLLAASPPCPSATDRSPAGLNAAGDRLAKLHLLPKDEEALACYQAAYESPPELHPPWACNNVTALLLRTQPFANHWEHAFRCVEEATDRELLAAAWFNMDRAGVDGAALVSYLIRPTPDAAWALARPPLSRKIAQSPLSEREQHEVLTGRPEVPKLIAKRLVNEDGLAEWLLLEDPQTPTSQPVVLPMAFRRPGACAAGRTWELVNGRVRIRATPEAPSQSPACERRVAPAGDFPLDVFLARLMRECVWERKVPDTVERLWAQFTRGMEGMEKPCTAALDLDADGDLDWILSEGRQGLIIENANPPRALGRVFGVPPEALRHRERGHFVLRTWPGAGPGGAADHFYVFDGKRYVEGPARPEYE